MLCFALLSFALLCFAMLCFALLCFALRCFALLSFAKKRQQKTFKIFLMFLTFWICLTFLTFHFGARNQALEAQGTRGPGNQAGSQEPGARAGPHSSPIALEHNKNPL